MNMHDIHLKFKGATSADDQFEVYKEYYSLMTEEQLEVSIGNTRKSFELQKDLSNKSIIGLFALIELYMSKEL